MEEGASSLLDRLRTPHVLAGLGAFMLGLYRLMKIVPWWFPTAWVRDPLLFINNLVAFLTFVLGPTLLVVGLMLWVEEVFGSPPASR